jgi:hypothetical protein
VPERARLSRRSSLCAAAGCVGQTFGRKKTIEREVYRTKTRDAALYQRDTDHSRNHNYNAR